MLMKRYDYNGWVYISRKKTKYTLEKPGKSCQNTHICVAFRSTQHSVIAYIMLDSHVDECNVEGQSEAPAVEEVQQDKSNSSHLQTQNLDVAEASLEVDCSLPDLPLKTLMTHIDIIGRLREQGEIRNLLGFQPSPRLETLPEISEDDICPVPYFIPELEMSCASAEAGQMNELTSASLEDPNAAGIYVSELLDMLEPNPSRIEELNVPRTEKENDYMMQEPQVSEINLPEIEEANFEEQAGPSAVKNVSQELVTKPVNQEPLSTINIGQNPTQNDESIAVVIEKPIPGPTSGIISSMIGLKPIFRPSVRLCFGDREQRRTDTPTQEEIKQQTSIALKSLIMSISLFKEFEASFQEKLNENELNQLDGASNSPTFSRVFKGNVFQPAAVPENRQEERHEEHPEQLPENALAGGEPVEQRRIIPNERLRRVLYRQDVSDAWASRVNDSDSSECSDSDDSGINNNMCMNGLSRQIMKMNLPIADRQDIETSGRILFSQPVKLFRFNSDKNWHREGFETPYTGDIKIMERDGKYYLLLREKNTGFLLVYTRVDGSWHIGYRANWTNSCSWINFNYAYCPEGTPEHFACTFREPSHAAEFVARIRNLVIKCRFVSST